MLPNILGCCTVIAVWVVGFYLVRHELPRLEARLTIGQSYQVGFLGLIGALIVLIVPGLLGMYKAKFDLALAVPVFVGALGWLFFGNLIVRTFLLRSKQPPQADRNNVRRKGKRK
jgi:hypothetical protein